MNINEADYKAISKLRNDNFNYELKIDMANEIINDISDNVYIISNKLEAIQKMQLEEVDVFFEQFYPAYEKTLDEL